MHSSKPVKFLKSLGIIAFLILTLGALFPINTSLNSRDSELLALKPVKEYKVALTAQSYCEEVLQKNYSAIHCTTINPQYTGTPNIHAQDLAKRELSNAINSYQSLLDLLSSSDNPSGQLFELIDSVNRKKQQLTSATNYGKDLSPSSDYITKFNALLSAQGMSYSAYSNKFKSLPQSIANYTINQSKLQLQLSTLKFLSTYSPLLIFIAFGSILLICSRIIKPDGIFYIAFYFLAISIGINIVRDASLHYGYESTNFVLNPFRQLLERQTLIYIASITLFFISAVYANKIGSLFHKLHEKLPLSGLAGTSICLTILAYLIFGSAIGSETFKIVSCLIAAGLLTRYGRAIELAQEQFGLRVIAVTSIRNFRLRNLLSFKFNKNIDLDEYFSYFAIRKITFHIFLMLGLILTVSIAFSDLGGSLVAASLFLFSLFILLGNKFAAILSVTLAILSNAIYISSEKVQGRVALMLEPMQANISDFARLIQFNDAAQPFGYGSGSIQWCSNEGVCLPLQSLSDYMPTLISGLIGQGLSFIFIGVFGLILLRLSYIAFINSWFYSDELKFIKSFGSLLCLAAFFQLLVTVLGNLRIIPLTGLGTPLISIGISSSITASIGMGLVIGLCFNKNK
jgi:cell division protein FtsW (lipid II flippase)